MHRRIGTPRPPTLGGCQGLTRVVCFECLQDTKIAVRKRIGPSKDPHREILNGPITNAGKLLQFGQYLIDRDRDIEIDKPVGNGLSHREN